MVRPPDDGVDQARGGCDGFGALGCPDVPEAKGRATVYNIQKADLTGDGRNEAVVTAACFTTTASNAAQVIVFDGAHTQGKLRKLLTVGKDQYLVTADVRIEGDTLTVKSKALSDQAPRCCPDLRITQAYSWDEDAFVQVKMERKAI